MDGKKSNEMLSQSENREEENYKKVSDIKLSQTNWLNEDGDEKQGTTQEYFKEFYSAIKYYFQNTENQSLKIGNDAYMLLYLMNNLWMLYNGKHVFSEISVEFSKNI